MKEALSKQVTQMLAYRGILAHTLVTDYISDSFVDFRNVPRGPIHFVPQAIAHRIHWGRRQIQESEQNAAKLQATAVLHKVVSVAR